MWPSPPNMNGERMPLPNKLIAVSIDKDRGSQSALKWTVDHLLARGQTVLLIHVKLKQSSNSSQSPSTKTNQNSNEGGSENIQLDPQTKDLFLPFRVFCTRKDIQCYDVVLDDTDVAKAIVEYVNRTGVEVLIVGASTRGGLSDLKQEDIPGGVSKGAPDFCTVHVISKSGKISSTRAASRSAPFVHPLCHQLMQPASTKFAPFDTSTPSSTNSRSSFPGDPKLFCDLLPSTLQSDPMSIMYPFIHSASSRIPKKGRTDGVESSRSAVVEDDDEYEDDAPLTQSQPPVDPLLEEDLATVHRILGGHFAQTPAPVPPATVMEVEMLRRQLRWERRKSIERDRLMMKMWKTINVIFSSVAPQRELPRLEPDDFRNFPFLNEASAGEYPPEDLDLDVDTPPRPR